MDEKQFVFKEGLIGFEEDGSAYLRASRCKACGQVYFPARDFCTECYSGDMEEIALKEGELHVYTVVYIGVKGFETPYILAWVKFPEGPRIVAQIDFPPERAQELRTGMKLRAVYGKLRTLEDGREVMGYRFRPVFDEEESI